MNDLRIGRGRRCELKNGDDIAIVLLPEKRSRRSDDCPIASKVPNDDSNDEERCDYQNDRVCYNLKTDNKVCSNRLSPKCENRP